MKLPSLSLAFFALKSISSDSNSSFLLVTVSFPLLIDLVFIFNAYRHHIAVSCFFILSETSTSSFGIFRLFIFSTISGKFRTKSILLLFFLQFPFHNFLYLSLAVLGPGDCGCCSPLGYTGGHPPAAGCGPLLLWSTGSRRPGCSSCSSCAQSCRFQALEHGLSCSAGDGILPDQGLNLGLLSWQKDSLPVS